MSSANNIFTRNMETYTFPDHVGEITVVSSVVNWPVSLYNNK